jgi:hypothetical protein
MYPRNDLNVHGYKPTKLKLALSTNSSTRIKKIFFYADKGVAPLFFDHEPNMFLLH